MDTWDRLWYAIVLERNRNVARSSCCARMKARVHVLAFRGTSMRVGSRAVHAHL